MISHEALALQIIVRYEMREARFDVHVRFWFKTADGFWLESINNITVAILVDEPESNFVGKGSLQDTVKLAFQDHKKNKDM